MAEFLNAACGRPECEIITLNDPLGPAASDPQVILQTAPSILGRHCQLTPWLIAYLPILSIQLDAIVLSSETLAAIPAIHEERQRANLKPIQVLVLRRTQAATLSSTILRRSEIHTAGGQLAEVAKKQQTWPKSR